MLFPASRVKHFLFIDSQRTVTTFSGSQTFLFRMGNALPLQTAHAAVEGVKRKENPDQRRAVRFLVALFRSLCRLQNQLPGSGGNFGFLILGEGGGSFKCLWRTASACSEKGVSQTFRTLERRLNRCPYAHPLMPLGLFGRHIVWRSHYGAGHRRPLASALRHSKSMKFYVTRAFDRIFCV